MRAPLRLLPLLALLARCVEFEDPVGLGLARDTRIEIAFELSNDPLRVACPVGGAAAPDSAVLCVTASIDPGYSPLGERLRVLEDSLRVMGTALAPAVGEDGVLRYAGRFLLPTDRLEEIPFTATIPRVEGTPPASREIRWFAAGPAGPDTLTRGAGEGVVLRVDRPSGSSVPVPNGQNSWTVEASGETTSLLYVGSGVPGTAYEFPSAVLDALGGTRFGAQLRWFRSAVISTGDLQAIVRLNERLDWTVRTREEEPTEGGGGL